MARSLIGHCYHPKRTALITKGHSMGEERMPRVTQASRLEPATCYNPINQQR